MHLLSEKIMAMMVPRTPLKHLLQKLQNLPPELQELVFSFMLDSPGGYVLFYKKALDVLEHLRLWPEKRHRSISSNGELFVRWDRVGQSPCLAGLYEKNTKGSIQSKVDDKDWDYIVLQWNDMRITKIAFVGYDSALATASVSGCVQILRRPTDEKLWITMEVFVIDLYKENRC
jgi:hypothetical protein